MPSEPEQRCSGRRHRGRVVCSRQHRSARVRCTSGEKCSHSDLGARTFKRRILPLAHTLIWCKEHVWGGQRRFQRAARAQGATPAARLVWVVWRQNRRFQPRAPRTAATPRGASRTRSGPDPAWRVGRRCQANQSGGAAAAGAAAGSSAVGNTAALVYGVPPVKSARILTLALVFSKGAYRRLYIRLYGARSTSGTVRRGPTVSRGRGSQPLPHGWFGCFSGCRRGGVF